ncbi:hypothetical protein OKW22_000084 [Bacilli bacterium PM5-3]|nr:hypothetical protein [Bacilli bacterium PM5-3]
MKKRFNFLAIALAFFCLLTSNVNADSVEDWNGFGGNRENNKITYSKTPTSLEDIRSITTVKSSGYVMDPVIIGDKMYAVSGSELVEFNKDGSLTGRKTSVGYVGFFSKIAFGENKIFIAASKNIVAVDIDTFKPIWKTEVIDNVQALSAITYYNGYIYSGYTIPKGASSMPSDGFFFAINVKDDDTSKSDEIKEFAWTYPKEEENQVDSGYYWADPVIVNNAVIFAGDNGEVISHHLTTDLIFDKYQLSPSSDVRKVRSTIVYDKKENAIYVGTQDTHELYKIPMLDRTFDRSNIIMNDEVKTISGGFAIGEKNIYVPSGGQSGKGFSVLDKDLNLIGTEMAYGTQSIPLVSEFSDGATYVYFLEYVSGKLIIAKDLNNGTMPTFIEYKSDDMKAYNSNSVTPFYDGTLVIPYNDFSNGGFVFIDSKSKEVTKSDIEVLIEKSSTMTKYTDYDKISDIKKRVDNFKNDNTGIVISNEEKLSNNYDLVIESMNQEAAKLNSLVMMDSLKTEKLLANYTNLSSDAQNSINSMYLTFLEQSSDGFWDSFKKNIYPNTIINDVNNIKGIVNGNEKIAYKYKAYIDHINANYQNLRDEIEKEKIKPIIEELVYMSTLEENKEVYNELDKKISNIPDSLSLKNKGYIVEIESLLSGLSKDAQKIYIENNEAGYQMYEAAKKEISAQQELVNKINEDIELIDPNKVTYNDKVLVDSIIARYNSLSAENKTFVSDWYENILDAKKAIDKITIRTEKKGSTTYTYQKVNNKWLLIKKYTETKKDGIITKKQTLTYNVKGKLTSNTTIQRSKNKKYVTTLANIRTYYSSVKLKSNKTTTRNLNTGKLVKVKVTSYYKNGKKQRDTTTNYKSGKKSTYVDYRYNKKGQLKSNKYGKAYYTKKTYKNGKLKKTLKYRYNAKGKKVKR